MAYFDTDVILEESEEEVVVEKRDFSKYRFYQVERYGRYFDVDTVDVLRRVLHSMVPFLNKEYYAEMGRNPDLYGPFWITTTVIIAMAVTGNVVSFITDTEFSGQHIIKLVYGAAVIYGYCFIIPLGFWVLFFWQEIPIKLIYLYCFYGYSLFIYIPIAILCIIPFWWLSVIFIAIGAVVSTGFLSYSFFEPINRSSKKGYIIVGVMAFLHIALAVVMRVYFFNYHWNGIPIPIHNTTLITTATTNTMDTNTNSATTGAF
eukprot:TRINITY_DN725_c0_g1_i1.p1 TRINITY_DN725_c0_g1~~TRINITY_DN725_c0_g1_i1.p1  ORF type:complete len:260 (-),score=37.58 TRINITY_DN725_c0_g1_i1:37-816(-)